MRSVPASNVLLSGDTYARALKNFTRLHDAYYRPGQIGREPACLPDWPGDWEGRTILALSLYAQNMHVRPAFLDEIVLDVYQRCNEQGCRGDVIDPQAISEQVYPSHSWLMRGLIAYYRLTEKPYVLAWINRIIDNLFLPLSEYLDSYPRNSQIDLAGAHAAGTIQTGYGKWLLSSDAGCILIPLDGLTEAYAFTGRPELAPLIERLIGLFDQIDYVKAKLQTHASLTCMRGVMRYMRYTGNRALLEKIEAFFKAYKLYGMTAFYANMNWFRTPSWTEPCAVIDSFMLAQQLFEETENIDYLNDAHKILYNGFFRGQRPNGGFGCDLTVEDGMLRTRSRTYEALWCCTMRAGEGFSAIPAMCVYEREDAVCFAHLMSMDVTVSGALLALRTDYPKAGCVQLSVVRGDGQTKRIGLFLSQSASQPKVTIEGEEAPITVENGFVFVDLPLRTGMQLSYTFTLTLHSETVHSAIEAIDQKKLACFGPLILGADETAPVQLDLSAYAQGKPAVFSNGVHTLKPINEGYLMTKEDLIAENRRILFERLC